MPFCHSSLARLTYHAFGLLAASTVLWSCGNDSSPSTLQCVEGSTAACVCPGGGSGSQVCKGGAFGVCDCGTAQDANTAGDVQDGGATDAVVTATDVGPEGSDAASGGSDVLLDASAHDSAGNSDAGAAGTDAIGPISCVSDKDCKDTEQICDPLTKACVDCLTDSDCGPQQHCKSRICVNYTPCSNSLGCVSATGPAGEEQAICDAQQAECVACLSNTDCPANHDCVQKSCVPFTPCGNSKDCLTTEVCDTSIGRCAQCLGDNDCAASQLCEGGQCRDFAACSSDKQCTPLGMLCDQSKGKCAQCLTNTDCPDIYHCAPTGTAGTGVCTLDVCAQGQGACASNAKLSCNAVGNGFGLPVPCPSQTTCAAPGGKPECKAWVCKPGVSCDGNKAVACSDDGLSVLGTVDCVAEGGKCVAGVCKPLVCEPGQVYCDGQTKKYCSPDGLSVAQSQPCASGNYCEAGACKPQVCVPGSSVCDGNTATQCNAAGSGFAGGGTDCGALVCEQGACAPIVCTPNTLFCDGNVPKACNSKGTDASGTVACGPGQYCEAGKCLLQLCTPGQTACASNTPSVCNAQGSAWLATAPACGDGTVCNGGVCTSQLCLPGSKVCSGNKVLTCSSDGLTQSITQTCGTGTYCGSSPSGIAGCQPSVCTPGELTCAGTVSVTCNATGSGAEDGGFDCASVDKVCTGKGLCKSKVCDPANPSYCDGKTALKCDASGASPTVVKQCSASEYCENGACKAALCVAGQLTCSGNQPALCNALGNGFEQVQTPCATGTGCDPAVGACTKSECGDGACHPQETASCAVDCGCGSAPSGMTCNDQNACTKNDICSSGSCVGAGVVCNDNNAATIDQCDPILGCVYKTPQPELCNGVDDDLDGQTDDVQCSGKSCTCLPDGTALCPTGCAVCADPGAIPVSFDDDGVARVLCAVDYPQWGALPVSPATSVYQIHGNGTLTDTSTGRMWQADANTTAYTWSQAVSYCNALTLDSKTDWRLPTVAELESLVDYAKTNPAINTTGFAGTTANAYWTARTSAIASADRWTVRFKDGLVTTLAATTATNNVRCVRSHLAPAGPLGLTSANRFEVDTANGVVLDQTTTLVWQASATATAMSWTSAPNYCSALTLAGGSWRLPTIRELASITDRGKSSPALSATAFPGALSEGYWSDTQFPTTDPWAFSVNGATGAIGPATTSGAYRVRCVRKAVCGDNLCALSEKSSCPADCGCPGGGKPKVFYLDKDKDGYGGTVASPAACTAPADYVANNADCDDNSAQTSPGANEVCDGKDNTCDGTTDGIGYSGCKIYYVDFDGDKFGNSKNSACICPFSKPASYVETSGDCDDSKSDVSPGSPEVCDGNVDNNCDAKTDEEDAEGCQLWYTDADSDGYGATASGKCLCKSTATHVAQKPGDCNDVPTDAVTGIKGINVNPAKLELCNNIDDDCTGGIDDGLASAQCPAVEGGNPACLAGGICGVGKCPVGKFDVNDSAQDGCECQADSNYGSKGQSCGNAVDVGEMPDGTASKLVVGNIMPGEGGDWYHFYAKDVIDTDNGCDAHSVRVQFASNPGTQFWFDVYRGSCAGGNQICANETDHSWSTNFYSTMPGNTPGPQGDKSGNRSNYSNPGQHPSGVSPVPEKFGECKCVTAKTASNQLSVPGVNICSDNSAHYYVRVFRKPGVAATCSNYTLRIDNAP